MGMLGLPGNGLPHPTQPAASSAARGRLAVRQRRHEPPGTGDQWMQGSKCDLLISLRRFPRCGAPNAVHCSYHPRTRLARGGSEAALQHELLPSRSSFFTPRLQSLMLSFSIRLTFVGEASVLQRSPIFPTYSGY